MAKTGISIRKRGNRWYGDFRRFGDGQRALSPDLIGEPGGTRGATSKSEAERIAEEYARQLRTGADPRQAQRAGPAVSLGDYVDEFLSYLRTTPKPNGDLRTDRYLTDVERYLGTAGEFFGAHRPLASITPADVERYLADVRRRGYSGRTVRVHLEKLSQLFRRAIRHRRLTFNPVDAVREDLPTGRPENERGTLEAAEAWALMQAARKYDEESGHYMHPLIALWLHTGIGPREAFTRRVGDVCFAGPGAGIRERAGAPEAEGLVVVAANEWSGRRLKTEYRARQVPLWPDCAQVLEEYTRDRLPEAPLFPSPKRAGEPVTTVRRAFKSVLELQRREARKEGDPEFAHDVTPYWLRHTYASHRLQTTEGGAPVAIFTVARELGHASTRMIEQHYGHVLADRSARSEVVSFRPAPSIVPDSEAGAAS